MIGNMQYHMNRKLVDCVLNMMAHAQKPDFVFRRNEQIHLNRLWRQFSRLLAAEMCASAVLMRDTQSSEVVKSAGYPLHSPVSPSLFLPCVTVCHHVSTGLYFWDCKNSKASGDWDGRKHLVENLFEVTIWLIYHGYEFLRSQLTELRYLSYCYLVTETEKPVETVEFHSVLTRLPSEKTLDLSLNWSVFVSTYRVGAASSTFVPECCWACLFTC